MEPKEEDVIPNTPSLITFSSRGYIKRMPVSTWDVQKRGGKGELGWPLLTTAQLAAASCTGQPGGCTAAQPTQHRSGSFPNPTVTHVCDTPCRQGVRQAARPGRVGRAAVLPGA